MSKGLEKVIEENGLVYCLAENGCYYPDLKMEQKTDYPIGKYGIMRAEYMLEHQRYRYLKMAMEGSWNEYLHEVDEECRMEVELAVERIKEKEGVTEEMKKNNPIEWVRKVNGIKERVEEIMVLDIMCFHDDEIKE